jgi:hypothetical protein
MSEKRRGRKKSEKYERDPEQGIAEYIAATGDQSWTLTKVAAWMIAQGKWAQERESAVRQLTRHLRRVARQVHIIDEETGKEVRKYHAFRCGEQQPMLWASMESITREQMDESKTMRRNTLAGGCIQLARDLDHFNRNYNPGDPIPFNPDFTKDIEDDAHSSDYDDTPPDESESD